MTIEMSVPPTYTPLHRPCVFLLFAYGRTIPAAEFYKL